jgi:hypothetical protein
LSVLTKIETQSAVYQKLAAHYRDRLATLRAQNDGDLDAVSTAKQRGRILEAKAFLELGEVRPPVKPDPLDDVQY